MRGLNYNKMLKEWDRIIDKVCEECTPHDVLMVVRQHLERQATKNKELGLKGDKFDKAVKHITQAMKHINPEP